MWENKGLRRPQSAQMKEMKAPGCPQEPGAAAVLWLSQVQVQVQHSSVEELLHEELLQRRSFSTRMDGESSWTWTSGEELS